MKPGLIFLATLFHSFFYFNSLVVVNDFNFRRSVRGSPEADATLIVNSYAHKSITASLQCFEPEAWRNFQIIQTYCNV